MQFFKLFLVAGSLALVGCDPVELRLGTPAEAAPPPSPPSAPGSIIPELSGVLRKAAVMDSAAADLEVRAAQLRAAADVLRAEP